MANYVKFLRGTKSAYTNLQHKDDDTLYFIYENSESSGQLYLGSKLIAGSDVSGNVKLLSDIQDVLIDENLRPDDCLVYDISGKWVNKPIADILPIFVGTFGEVDGIAGLVPAPDATEANMFLRSDGTWAEVVTASVDSDNVTLKNNNGVLSIAGFEDAQTGTYPAKNQNG